MQVCSSHCWNSFVMGEGECRKINLPSLLSPKLFQYQRQSIPGFREWSGPCTEFFFLQFCQCKMWLHSPSFEWLFRCNWFLGNLSSDPAFGILPRSSSIVWRRQRPGYEVSSSSVSMRLRKALPSMWKTNITHVDKMESNISTLQYFCRVWQNTAFLTPCLPPKDEWL